MGAVTTISDWRELPEVLAAKTLLCEALVVQHREELQHLFTRQDELKEQIINCSLALVRARRELRIRKKVKKDE